MSIVVHSLGQCLACSAAPLRM